MTTIDNNLLISCVFVFLSGLLFDGRHFFMGGMAAALAVIHVLSTLRKCGHE